jgi:outer membrane protein assembly factor BamD (BamD/ComL family)
MRRTAVAVGLLAVAGPLLAACSSSGARPRRPLQVPNAVSGGTRGGGRPEAPNPERVREEERAIAEEKAASASVEKQREAAKADALWQSAQALESRNAEDAADAYQSLGHDYPGHVRADEAWYREAVLRYRLRDWNGTQRALEQYMKVAPVNAHLADVERMLYEAGTRILAEARGFAGVFRSKKRGFDALNFVADNFPAGRYADDALIAIGDEYFREGDYESAALQYQELLLRFPDSEWSFMARLKLGDSHLARDQGANYHAGYVDLDPRGRTDDAYKQGRPVRSCLAAALEQYEAFLERVTVDPARRAEYAPHVSYAHTKVVECRRRLADKERRTAAFYGGRAGSVYEESARGLERGAPLGRNAGINGGAVPVVNTPLAPPPPRTDASVRPPAPPPPPPEPPPPVPAAPGPPPPSSDDPTPLPPVPPTDTRRAPQGNAPR